MNAKPDTSPHSLRHIDLRKDQSSSVNNFNSGKRPVLYVTDSTGQVVFKLILKRRKRQVVIKVKDPKIDLNLFEQFLVEKLRERVEGGGY